VQEVVPNGPSDKVGLRGGRTAVGQDLSAGGDILVKVDGEEIMRPDDVATSILDNKPGDTVVVEYYRGDDRKSVKVKLGTRPNELSVPQDSELPPDESLPFP
jgi:S1-C subfamily serine protease